MPCIYVVLRFMHLRVLVFLVFLGFIGFLGFIVSLHDFRRVLFAPPPGLGEALGEPLGEGLGVGPRLTFFCNLTSYSR